MKFEKATYGNFQAKLVVIGPSGGGKSTSALRLATGMARGGLVCVIDTDNGRSRLNAREYDFQVCQLDPPHNGDRYIEAIDAALQLNPTVLVIDTVSEEHVAMLAAYDEAVDALVKQFRSTPDKMSMGGWNVAKKPRKRLQAKLRSLPCHLILCMRAGEKMNVSTKRMELDIQGHQGFIEDSTATFYLPPNSDGIPDPKPTGAISAVAKLPRDLREHVKPGVALCEAHGDAIRGVADGDTPAELDSLVDRVAACMSVEQLGELSKTLKGLNAAGKKVASKLMTARKAELETTIKTGPTQDDGPGTGPPSEDE